MNFLTVLPLAFVMVVGSQFIGAVFLATGRDAKRTSAAYLAGAGTAVLVGVTASYWLVRWLKLSFDSGAEQGPVGRWIDVVVLVLLVVLMINAFLHRHRSDPPTWMGRLETAGPGLAARLGLLLIIAMPSDDLTMITVGASLARHDRPWWHVLPFVLFTVLLLALPLLCLLLLGRRAEAVLPKIRDWANSHSWIISEVVLVFFVGLTVVSLLR
ncbi:GAP family protein [Solwaraspora sp. WMMD1047]|uniref:GAP family protein n=1 Tax=Solwaraspora sp. WMMD1047 TaxID=3016102 RepID=UPI00241661B5|nr:GAP family protein [Solwaraspora sp. WMMD1047]MDG4834695.1 GAP family protein [Solwaraspora sp. WMMD1047]